MPPPRPHCSCVHTCSASSPCTCVHTCPRPSPRTCVHTCPHLGSMHLCSHLFPALPHAPVFTPVPAHSHAPVFTPVFTCPRPFPRTCVHTCVYTCVYTCVHLSMPIPTHLCSHLYSPVPTHPHALPCSHLHLPLPTHLCSPAPARPLCTCAHTCPCPLRHPPCTHAFVTPHTPTCASILSSASAAAYLFTLLIACEHSLSSVHGSRFPLSLGCCLVPPMCRVGWGLL